MRGADAPRAMDETAASPDSARVQPPLRPPSLGEMPNSRRSPSPARQAQRPAEQAESGFTLSRAIAGSRPEVAFAQLHPAEVPGRPGYVMRNGEEVAAYHVIQHTENVARAAYDLTLARARAGDFTAQDRTLFGSPEGKAQFMSQVGILHDADPRRDAGAPARVPATLEWMRSQEGRTFMRERFGWDESTPQGRLRIAMAGAIIQRTEFPFDSKTRPVRTWPNDPEAARTAIGGHYGTESPTARYTNMVREISGLSPDARDFVLREAAFFSEYADKSSWYFERPDVALLTVTGLTNEVRAVLPPGVNAPDFLPTTRGQFLDSIGRPASFGEDARIARELGAPEPRIPGRDEMIGMLGAGQRRNWASTNEMFGLVEIYHRRWDVAAPTNPEELARFNSLLSADPATREAQVAMLRGLRSENLDTAQAARGIAQGFDREGCRCGRTVVACAPPALASGTGERGIDAGIIDSGYVPERDNREDAGNPEVE